MKGELGNVCPLADFEGQIQKLVLGDVHRLELFEIAHGIRKFGQAVVTQVQVFQVRKVADGFGEFHQVVFAYGKFFQFLELGNVIGEFHEHVAVEDELFEVFQFEKFLRKDSQFFLGKV